MIYDSTEVYYPRYLTFPGDQSFYASGIRMYRGIRKLVTVIRSEFDFDIVHAHWALPDGFAGMLIRDRYNKPLIVTPQAPDIDINLSNRSKFFKAVHKLLRDSNMVITPSASINAKLQEKTGMTTEAIPYGIYENDIFTSTSPLYIKYSGHIILLSVSQLIPRKGIEFNLKAFAQLKKKYDSLHYLIIGDGELKDRLIKLVKDLCIQDSVEFLGKLPHSEVMEFMSFCDIFSLPSWRETLGLVYFEAMSHGKPIIGCLGQGVDGLIVNGKTGLMVKPKDVETLVQAISYLLDNPAKASEIGEQAKKLVLENYTWDKIGRKHLEIYKRLLVDYR
jgi:glycosyltransferase involved in cell wall biosynthesis